MSIFESSPKLNPNNDNVFVVEVGTKYVTVYHGGTILREPSLIAIKRENGVLNVEKVGSDVYGLRRDPTGAATIIAPISEGAVVNRDAAVQMVSALLGKVIHKSFLHRPTIVLAMPCGLTPTEREVMEGVMARAGYKDFISTELINGLAGSMPTGGGISIILGAGVTDIGILNNNKIESACTLNIAGKTIDEKIAYHIADMGTARISMAVAEAIKKDVGSLFENDRSSVAANGYDILDRTVSKIYVSSADIRPCITYCFDRILDVTESLLSTIPQQMKDLVAANGIYFAGGGANIRGLAEYTRKKTGMPAHILADPETAALRGLYEHFTNKK